MLEDHRVAESHQKGWKRATSRPPSLICERYIGTQLLATAKQLRRQTMQGFKGVLLVAAVITAVALGACRREVEHQPLKLGAEVPAAAEVTR